MRFFKSKDVKIFPCSNRGTYTYSSKDLVFDPESRRASEYNFTHLSGRDLGKDSYVIGYDDANELLKVVLGGYYFEIHTKFSGLTFAQPEGNLGSTYNLDQCTLWLTLQKIAIANATSADSARSTQQLASLFSRVLVSEETYKNYDYYYATVAAGTTGEVYHLTPEVVSDSEEGNTWWEIDPSCINLSTLDFPATYRSDAQTGSSSDPEPEYFCAAVGITSSVSAKPSLATDPESGYYPIISDEGEDLSGCLISLDLSKADNWLENIAVSEFLYNEGDPDWVECQKHFKADQAELETLKVTSQLETKDLTATGKSDLQNVTATIIQADELQPNDGEGKALNITATAISANTISAVETLSAETIDVPSMEAIIISSTDAEDPPTAICETLKEKVAGMINDAEERVKEQLIGDIILRAENNADPENPIEAIEIDDDNLSIAGLYGKEKCVVIDGKTGANTDDWSDEIPSDLTLTGLKKEISLLTVAGGEPTPIEELFVGETKLVPTNKQVDLDQQLSIANLSDGARVTTIEETLNGKDEANGNSTIGLVAKVEDLEANIKNLDNIMNFRGIITPSDLVYLTGGCTGTLLDDSDLKNWTSSITIEVGDVVIVRSKQATTDHFDYLGKSYYNNTEFICTAVTETKTTWQEIGNCDITDSLIREIIGEDTDTNRTGSIKERLCNAEDSISNIQDDNTEGTISYRINTIEDVLGDNTDKDSIQGRLTALETLTGTEGAIRNAIATNTEAIITIEETLGTDTTASSVLGRLTAVEATISGTSSGGAEGETGGSLPDRVTALEGEVSSINDVIGTVEDEGETLIGRLNALEGETFKASIKNSIIGDAPFKASITSLVINDDTFKNTVDKSLTDTVEGQTPGKVVDFILNDYDFANDPEFTGAVAGKVQIATETALSSLSVADIEFPEDPTDPNSEKIKIEDKVNEAFSSEAKAVDLDTLTFKPGPGEDAITIAAAVSNAFEEQIKATDPSTTISSIVAETFNTQITDQTSGIESDITNKINTLIGTDLNSITTDRDLGNDTTVGTEITSIINTAVSTAIPSHTFDKPQNQSIKDVISGQVTTLIPSHIFTGDQNTILTGLIDGQVNVLAGGYDITKNTDAMQILSDKINGIFQQTLVLYAVAFDGNGVESPEPQAALGGCTIPLPTITREGYSFLGWSTTESEDNIVPIGPYKVLANQILHAIWQEVQEEELPETEG